jgi:hypothetical protein
MVRGRGTSRYPSAVLGKTLGGMGYARFLRACAAAAVVATLGAGAPSAVTATANTGATLAGRSIPVSDVRLYHCHNARAAVYSCFASASERDRDARRATRYLAAGSVAYVILYEHAYYGGASITLFDPVAHLGSLGWNDAVSSFKSLNGQRPKWWRDTYFAGTAWRWTAGAWVSYVGDAANDQFSSVDNVP